MKMVFTGRWRWYLLAGEDGIYWQVKIVFTCRWGWYLLAGEDGIYWQVKMVFLADEDGLYLQVKMVFLQWIPWLLRMSRPGEKLSLKSILMHRQMQEIDSKVSTTSTTTCTLYNNSTPVLVFINIFWLRDCTVICNFLPCVAALRSRSRLEPPILERLRSRFFGRSEHGAMQSGLF